MDRNELMMFLGGMLAGAGLMYVLDPVAGGRRRAVTRDKAAKAAHAMVDATGKAARDLRNRSKGMIAHVRSRTSSEPVDDDILLARVRSQLGHYAGHPKGIEVQVDQGLVTLAGPILAHEKARLLKKLAAIPGVESIEDLLDVHEEPGDVPSLQGEGTRAPLFKMTPSGWVLTAIGAGVLGMLGAARAHNGGESTEL